MKKLLIVLLIIPLISCSDEDVESISLNTVARGVSKVIDGTLADSFGHTIYPATSEESHRTFFYTSSDDDTTYSSSCSSQDVI